MSINFEINGGCDIGNGFIKTVLAAGTGRRDIIDMPSSVTVLTRPNALPIPDAEAMQVLSATDAAGNPQFYNELDASFNTPLVPDSYRRVFGTRSLTADGAFEEFDTMGRASKAKQPLSKILVLGMFAAKALRDFVLLHGSLPQEEIQVTARAALALPIAEFLRHRESYAAEFRAGSHLVMIENFETTVVVRIRFEDVQVLAEGASGQYAIVAHGESLINVMLADVRSRNEGSAELEELTAQDVIAFENTIGLDIGDGTCNTVVFTDGKPNIDASLTVDKGWGTVLTNALKAMEDQGIESGFNSRKELASFLQREPKRHQRAFFARVEQFVKQEADFYAQELTERLGRVLRNVGAQTEAIYVYGGGSGPLKELLYPKLQAKIHEMNSLYALPVLYLDAKYSRHLNREGLFIAVQTVAVKAAKNAQAAAPVASRSAAKKTAAPVEAGV